MRPRATESVDAILLQWEAREVIQGSDLVYSFRNIVTQEYLRPHLNTFNSPTTPFLWSIDDVEGQPGVHQWVVLLNLRIIISILTWNSVYDHARGKDACITLVGPHKSNNQSYHVGDYHVELLHAHSHCLFRFHCVNWTSAMNSNPGYSSVFSSTYLRKSIVI